MKNKNQLTLKHKIEQFREEFSPFVIQGRGEEMEAYIETLIKDALEACRVEEKYNPIVEPFAEGWNRNTTQYDENVKSFLGEEEV